MFQFLKISSTILRLSSGQHFKGRVLELLSLKNTYENLTIFADQVRILA